MKLCLLILVFSLLLAGCQTSNETIEFGNKTVVAFDEEHGVQVAYMSQNRRSYLWYPGNDQVTRGKWETRKIGSEICFNYPNAYNPVTKKSGGFWSCLVRSAYKRKLHASCVGDPFGLESGKIPFVLEKGRVQLGQLKKTCS